MLDSRRLVPPRWMLRVCLCYHTSCSTKVYPVQCGEPMRAAASGCPLRINLDPSLAWVLLSPPLLCLICIPVGLALDTTGYTEIALVSFHVARPVCTGMLMYLFSIPPRPPIGSHDWANRLELRSRLPYLKNRYAMYARSVGMQPWLRVGGPVR